jgi:hypothetical protein
VNIHGDAETHFRNVVVTRPEQYRDRWPLINRGVGTRVPPITDGVPIFIHDYFGIGRHAKVVSTAAKDLIGDGNNYREEFPLTSDESRVAEVSEVQWPKLLDPIDDLPPATMITSVREGDGKLVVCGVSHDNGQIVKTTVNGQQATFVSMRAGIVDWRIELPFPADGILKAAATDEANNEEQTGDVKVVAVSLRSGDSEPLR